MDFFLSVTVPEIIRLMSASSANFKIHFSSVQLNFVNSRFIISGCITEKLLLFRISRICFSSTSARVLDLSVLDEIADTPANGEAARAPVRLINIIIRNSLFFINGFCSQLPGIFYNKSEYTRIKSVVMILEDDMRYVK